MGRVSICFLLQIKSCAKKNVNATAARLTRKECGLDDDENNLVIGQNISDAKLKYFGTCITYRPTQWEEITVEITDRLLRRRNIEDALNKNIV